jgi:UDP-3-O-[3-hydroxymyristoyl] N-acetylglucosamine deacetylase
MDLPAANTISSTDTIRYSGKGTTSGRNIEVVMEKKPAGYGIKFEVTSYNGTAVISALAENVVNTLRNVVLGKESVRLCLVEHLLAALSLCGISDVLVKVNGPELPLEDGSAKFWTDCLEKAGWKSSLPEADIELKQPIIISSSVNSSDKLLLAIPDDSFSVSYLMDWNHPLIGKRWQSWSPAQEIQEITDARTFGWMSDHQALGIAQDSLSLTSDGFTKPLRFEDEPVRHKLLDLVGDLTLCGANPLCFKARFISIKGGHGLDVQMASALSKLL